MTERVQSGDEGVRLDTREQAFVDAYLGEAHGDGSKAAIASGYADGSARQRAHKLLRRPRVAAEILRRQEEAARRVDVSRDAVLRRLWEIGNASPDQLAEMSAGGAVRVSVGAEASALKEISRMQGWATPQKHEVSGPGAGPVQHAHGVSQEAVDAVLRRVVGLEVDGA